MGRSGEHGRLRVFFVTEDDPIYVAEFFNVFLADYPRESFEVVGVTVVRAFNEPLAATARRVLGLYGPVRFFGVLARYLWRRARGRTIARAAEAHGVPLYSTSSVNDPSFVDRVRTSEPEVIVSVAAPEVFGRSLLSVPRLGCINVHSGALPRYRGMMPVFWQMERGESQVTVTVHEMVERLDAGAVLAEGVVPLREEDSLNRVMIAAKHCAAGLVISVLHQKMSGTSAARPLDMESAEYFSFPDRTASRSLRSRGHSLM